MKKFLALSLAAALLAAATPAKAEGGIAGGIVGCCFGIRTAAAYNEGKSLHVRDILDWLCIGRVWSAIEGYNGTTLSDLHEEAPRYF